MKFVAAGARAALDEVAVRQRQPSRQTLVLSNPYERDIFFNVKTTHPRQHRVNPPVGRIIAGGKIELEVKHSPSLSDVVKLQMGKLSDKECQHKFIIQAAWLDKPLGESAEEELKVIADCRSDLAHKEESRKQDKQSGRPTMPKIYTTPSLKAYLLKPGCQGRRQRRVETPAQREARLRVPRAAAVAQAAGLVALVVEGHPRASFNGVYWAAAAGAHDGWPHYESARGMHLYYHQSQDGAFTHDKQWRLSTCFAGTAFAAWTSAPEGPVPKGQGMWWCAVEGQWVSRELMLIACATEAEVEQWVTLYPRCMYSPRAKPRAVTLVY